MDPLYRKINGKFIKKGKNKGIDPAPCIPAGLEGPTGTKSKNPPSFKKNFFEIKYIAAWKETLVYMPIVFKRG